MLSKPYIEERRVCLAYSAGGHDAELKRATEGIIFRDCYHVTFRSGKFKENDEVERYYLCHPRRKISRTLVNVIQSMRLLFRKRPAIILSTGADVTVPTIILGKLLLGAKVIFIESAGDLKPSLSGRLVYRFSDLFIIQWPEKKNTFPKAILADSLLL